LLFEKNTVRKLAQYFREHQKLPFERNSTDLRNPIDLGVRASSTVAAAPLQPTSAVAPAPILGAQPNASLSVSAVTSAATAVPVPTASPIAIVGLKGRYPGARTIEEFWDLLKAGRSGIGEVPADRWAWENYYAPKAKERLPGKAYTKWGGFIAGAYEFDPMFFQI